MQRDTDRSSGAYLFLLAAGMVLLLGGCGGKEMDGQGSREAASQSAAGAVVDKPTPDEATSPTAEAPLSFTFEFWSTRDDEFDGEVREPIPPQATMPPGNPLYMRLGLNGSCHVYVMTKDPAGGMAILYPEDLVQSPETGARTLLNKRSRLDKTTGKRRYYVFASAAPLTRLAERMASFREADEGSRAERQTALMAEIQRLRKGHERLDSATSKPASIGGSVRGGEDAVEITANGVYAKTYTVAIKEP